MDIKSKLHQDLHVPNRFRGKRSKAKHVLQWELIQIQQSCIAQIFKDLGLRWTEEHREKPKTQQTAYHKEKAISIVDIVLGVPGPTG